MIHFVRLVLTAGILLLLSLTTHASFEPQRTLSMEDLFAPYAELLRLYLIEKDLEGGGLVSAFRYQEALQDARVPDLLSAQRQRLAAFDPEQIDSREEGIAFWLNAYNFFMLAHILETPQRGRLIESVRDYGSFINPYRVFRQDIFEIGGRLFSLDEMEKGILLGDDYLEKGWFDARVHFAVNCASVGCPPLRIRIYTSENLDDMLAENTRRALRTKRHLVLEDGILYLSRLFQWYRKDYEEQAGTVSEFLKNHTEEALHPLIDDARDIRFMDYDWSLNKPGNFLEFDS